MIVGRSTAKSLAGAHSVLLASDLVACEVREPVPPARRCAARQRRSLVRARSGPHPSPEASVRLAGASSAKPLAQLSSTVSQSGKPLSMTCRMERRHNSWVMVIRSEVVTRCPATVCVSSILPVWTASDRAS